MGAGSAVPCECFFRWRTNAAVKPRKDTAQVH